MRAESRNRAKRGLQAERLGRRPFGNGAAGERTAECQVKGWEGCRLQQKERASELSRLSDCVAPWTGLG